MFFKFGSMDYSRLHSQLLKGGSVVIDSRKVQSSDIFFTISGDRFNANDFVEEVLSKGPSLVVMDEDRGIQDDRIIVVEDGLLALQEFARYHRDTLKIPVIGLTGSNGKTTSKELFKTVLSQQFQVQATEGNYNNHIGVPLSVLSVLPEHDIAIIEMGANAQKEIEFLCSISKPDIGYITNFGLAHLEGFGGPEGVIKGKSELYDYLRTHQKRAIVFSDSEKQIEKSEGIERVLFGTNASSPFGFKKGEELPTFQLIYEDKSIRTNLSGGYNYSNVAAAFTMGLLFAMPQEKIISGLERYVPTNQRSQIEKSERNTIIVDCYNANPSSVQLALQSLSKYAGKKMALLGDMFELGDYEAEEHQKIKDQALALGIDTIILVGNAYSSLSNEKGNVLQFPTTEDALDFLREQEQSGFTVLLKGSRGMRMERLLEFL